MVAFRCGAYISSVSTSPQSHPALPLVRSHGNGAAPHPIPHHARAPRCPVAGTEEPELAALRMLSISHATASFAELERHALSSDAAAQLRARLAAQGIEALVLDTCNRVELYWRSHSADDDAVATRAYFEATRAAIDDCHVAAAHGERVARQLFRLACGLESLVIGEGEILGQIRCALAGLEATAGTQTFLARVVHAALRCGGVARAETAIGAGSVSVASETVQALARRMGGLEGRTIVVLGAGEMAVKVARQLKAERAARVIVLNRTLERARFVATKVGGEAGPLETREARMAEADAVVCAARVPAPLVTADLVTRVLAGRPERPLFVADLSMPRAIATDVVGLAGVATLDLAGLEDVVSENRERRAREIPRVEAVIDRELDALRRRARQRMIRPIVAELKRRAEAIRREELARLQADGPLDDAAIERLTRRLVDRLVAAPAMALRHSETPVDLAHAQILHRLFALPDDAGGDGHAADD